MNTLDLLEKLIADGRQAVDLLECLDRAKAESADRELTISNLQSLTERLQLDLGNAQAEIRNLKQPHADLEDQPLDEIKHRIISVLANDPGDFELLAKDCNLSPSELRFHLEDPRMQRLTQASQMGLSVFVSLSAAGRQYAHGRPSVT